MSSRAFTLIFLGIIIIGAAILSFNKISNSVNISPSPSASDNNIKFDNQLTGSTQPTQSPSSPTRQFQTFQIFSPDQLAGKKATIVTDKGNIEFNIYPEATKAASSFIFLSLNHFFDGLIFHRVEDWVIQGGDPTGTGRGGPGYLFEDEPVTLPYVRGTVAMANAGPNTNGSQFFILKKDYPLEPKYTIFGEVTKGMDVVDKIAVGDVMKQVVISSQ